MGDLPTALLLPLALVPTTAHYLLHCQLLLIWQCSDCKAGFHPPTWNLWEGRMGKRRAMRRFPRIDLRTAGFSSPHAYWSSLLHSQGSARARSSQRPPQARKAPWLCLHSGTSFSLHPFCMYPTRNENNKIIIINPSSPSMKFVWF